MKLLPNTNPVHLKGRFLVTDPCYIFQNSEGSTWNEICELLSKNEELAAGVCMKDIRAMPIPSIENCRSLEDVSSINKVYEDARRDAENKIGSTRRNIVTQIEIDGKVVSIMSTAFGDGSYVVRYPSGGVKGSFGVDAGLFCFYPMEDKKSDLGPIIKVDGNLTCKNGNAYIDGKLIVDTFGER